MNIIIENQVTKERRSIAAGQTFRLEQNEMVIGTEKDVNEGKSLAEYQKTVTSVNDEIAKVDKRLEVIAKSKGIGLGDIVKTIANKMIDKGLIPEGYRDCKSCTQRHFKWNKIRFMTDDHIIEILKD